MKRALQIRAMELVLDKENVPPIRDIIIRQLYIIEDLLKKYENQ